MERVQTKTQTLTPPPPKSHAQWVRMKKTQKHDDYQSEGGKNTMFDQTNLKGHGWPGVDNSAGMNVRSQDSRRPEPVAMVGEGALAGEFLM